MLVSMTGFGSSSYEDSSLSINIELKSFNSRYFELNTKSFDYLVRLNTRLETI